MAFDYRGRKFLVATSKECRLWLLDRDNLGGADHRTALQITPLLCNDAQAFDAKGVWGAMAAWQDATGRQWVVVPFYGPVSREFKAPIEHARPTNGGVGAYTLEERDGKWQLVPQWLSRDMDLAEHAIVANGVIFTYGSGEDASQVVPGPRVRRSVWRAARRCGQHDCRPPDPWIAPRGAVRARRANRTRALEQRQRDHHVEPLQRPHGRQRPRVRHDVRWHDLRLRRDALEEPVMRSHRSYLLVVMCALAGAVGWAQGRNIGFEWPATNADAQRTSWLRLDPNISVENLSRPGFELQWREKLDNSPRQSASLSQGVTMNALFGFAARVVRDRGVEQRLCDRSRHRLSPVATSFRCSTSSTNFSMPRWNDRRGRRVSSISFRRPCSCLRQLPPVAGIAAASGCLAKACRWSWPDVTEAPDCVASAPIASAGTRPAAGCSRAGTPDRVYTVSSAGTLHVLGQVSGIDVERPTPFLPANARYSDLTAIGEHAVHEHERGLRRRCQWRLGDHADRRQQAGHLMENEWRQPGRQSRVHDQRQAPRRNRRRAPPAPADTPMPIVALDAKTLQPTDWFSSPSSEFVTTPVVIKSQRAWRSLSPRRATAAFSFSMPVCLAVQITPRLSLPRHHLRSNFAPDALATFEREGTRWLLVPVSRGHRRVQDRRREQHD